MMQNITWLFMIYFFVGGVAGRQNALDEVSYGHDNLRVVQG